MYDGLNEAADAHWWDEARYAVDEVLAERYQFARGFQYERLEEAGLDALVVLDESFTYHSDDGENAWTELTPAARTELNRGLAAAWRDECHRRGHEPAQRSLGRTPATRRRLDRRLGRSRPGRRRRTASSSRAGPSDLADPGEPPGHQETFRLPALGRRK